MNIHRYLISQGTPHSHAHMGFVIVLSKLYKKKEKEGGEMEEEEEGEEETFEENVCGS